MINWTERERSRKTKDLIRFFKRRTKTGKPYWCYRIHGPVYVVYAHEIGLVTEAENGMSYRKNYEALVNYFKLGFTWESLNERIEKEMGSSSKSCAACLHVIMAALGRAKKEMEENADTVGKKAT